MRAINRNLPWSLVALAMAVTSCGGEEVTPFPSGLTPLEVSSALRPSLPNVQRCPEVLNTTQGQRPDYEFAHGRGCVHATLAQVWTALIVPIVTVDRRRVSEFTTEPNPEDQYEVGFYVHNVVRDIITLRFTSTYRGGVIEGTANAPLARALVYRKTAGSSFVETLRDSIVVRPIDADNTEIEMVRHIKGAGTGAEAAELYLRDAFASVLARVHDRPLPTY